MAEKTERSENTELAEITQNDYDGWSRGEGTGRSWKVNTSETI